MTRRRASVAGAAARLLVSLASMAACLPEIGYAQVATQAADTGTKADAERAIQAYLALWAHDGDINPASVERFYAPRAIYYGHAFSRAQILADKRAYIRRWPQRSYREIPGSLSARCNADRSLCRVRVVMAWSRVGAGHAGSVTGRARLTFDFVPSDGARKIARESARGLRGAG